MFFKLLLFFWKEEEKCFFVYFFRGKLLSGVAFISLENIFYHTQNRVEVFVGQIKQRLVRARNGFDGLYST
jgi:hypothetical protein